ncbi:MAG: glycosyltransferase family 4 protein [Zoogloeaceae bacterium]|nr:glycosyltransferase family 4 protein [Zoogloeaceae bacterium]
MSRILVVTRNYPPLWGGMERLNLNMVEQLAVQHEVMLVAPTGAEGHVPDGVEVRRTAGGRLSRFLVSATLHSLREARRFRPEIVLGGSGLVAPIVLAAARLCGARSCVYAHGLDLAVPHRLYQAAWLPAIRAMDRVIVNSSATRDLALGKGVPTERIGIVHPGVDVPSEDRAARARFRTLHQLGEGPILLSVGRLTARKGLREFVGQVLPEVVSKHPTVILVVVGDAPTDALYARVQTIESIREEAERVGVAANVRFLGKRFGQELRDAYFGSDVHVFPVQELAGDPEGFGMVAVEAAAHGLPTVAYASGGVVDAIAEGRSGHLIPPGRAAQFAECVNQLLAHPVAPRRVIAFAGRFAWSQFGARIHQNLNDVHIKERP